MAFLTFLYVYFKFDLPLFNQNSQEQNWFVVFHKTWLNSSESDYKSECLKLYSRLRYPNENLFFNPPLREIPAHMFDEFTQHGKMPNKRNWYLNDFYPDS